MHVEQQVKFCRYGSLWWETLIVLGWITRSISPDGTAEMVRKRAVK